MSELSVHEKDSDHFNELMILDLHVPYAIVHQKNNQSMLDIHIRRDEAKLLLKGLQKILDNQVSLELVDGDANQS